MRHVYDNAPATYCFVYSSTSTSPTHFHLPQPASEYIQQMKTKTTVASVLGIDLSCTRHILHGMERYFCVPNGALIFRAIRFCLHMCGMYSVCSTSYANLFLNFAISNPLYEMGSICKSHFNPFVQHTNNQKSIYLHAPKSIIIIITNTTKNRRAPVHVLVDILFSFDAPLFFNLPLFISPAPVLM